MWRRFIEYSLVLLSGFLYAIALKYFVLPSKVILTGTEGIATALSYYFDSYHLFIILYVFFQFLLLIFAFMRVSRVFARRSLLSVGAVVVTLMILPELQFADPEPQNERIILVLFGGILAGVAKAIAFRNRGSTGDEDIIGAYCAVKYLKPVGSVAIVAAIVSTTFGLAMDLLKNGQFESVVNTLMYTCIYIFVSTETLNNLYRKFKITMLEIITNQKTIIGEAIAKVCPHRTYTVHRGMGGHGGGEFDIVRTIVTHEELPHIIDAVHETNASKFYYHHDLEGISGGYYISPIS